MKNSVFIATSVDGMIARADGEIDWLDAAGGGDSHEDYGYGAFFESVDCMVMGRGSYEKVVSFGGDWPYAGKRVVVLTTTLERPIDGYSDLVELYDGPIKALNDRLKSEGVQHVYVDGGKTIQSFLRAGLLHRMIITQIPILIGDGIPLFGTLNRDIPLTHVRTQSYPNGFVQNEYVIKI